MKKTMLIKGLMLMTMCLSVSSVWAQMPRCHYTNEDSVTIVTLLQKGPRPLLDYAREFLGCPYVAHTLELYPDDERLVLNTRELDCTTYVDVVVALTLCAQRGETTFEAFVRQLHQQRYWGGVCNGYPSRIHYFSDWIRDNTLLGFVKEVQTPNPPFTAVQTVKVDYMSSYPDKYVSLSRHPEYVPTIRQQEEDLTGRQFRFIPTKDVKNTRAMRNAVHDGDILAITSSNPHLDIAHLGIAVWHDDGLYMIDASSRLKKVVEEKMSMRQYLERRSDASGIRVVRLAEGTLRLR